MDEEGGGNTKNFDAGYVQQLRSILVGLAV